MKKLWPKTRLSPFAIAIACLLIVAAQEISYGEIRHVPADFATIQAAIDASVSGDTVLVSPGTYVENINYLGKNILVKSTAGAAVTTIEKGDGTKSLVRFVSYETRQATLDGFRIANATYSAAIKCSESSPSIIRCIIEDNISVGISFTYGSPSIFGNEIRDNGSIGITGDWSGIEEIEIVGNTISGNNGHGIQIMQSGRTIRIEHNQLSQNKRGILVRYARESTVIRHNLIANTNSEDAIEVSGGVGFEISSNTIYGAVRGIGIPYSETFATGTDNIIVGCSDYALYDPFHCLTRTMFWDNEQDWYSAFPVSPARYVRANPEFTSPETGDFSLRCDSPAIDAGSPDLLDADGTRADIGAFPFDHNAHAPEAMDFSVSGENQFMVHSPKITFVWRPRTSSSQTIVIDTLYCISNPISGEEFCYTDTTIIAQVASQLGYELEFGTDSDWSVAELLATGDVTASDSTVSFSRFPLAAGETYYARLRLRDKTGWGCWRQLILRRNAAPSVPVPFNPQNGARMWVGEARLTTTRMSDAESDSVRCIFELYSDQLLTELIVADTVLQTSTASLILSNRLQGLQSSTAYWWRARSSDGHDLSDWSDTGNFVAWETRSFRVPDDYSKIQLAIDYASDGDTILVSPGTYKESLRFKRKAISLIGRDGSDLTIFRDSTASAIIAELPISPKISTIRGIHFESAKQVVASNGDAKIVQCRFTRLVGSSAQRTTLFINGNVEVDSCVFDGRYHMAIGGLIGQSRKITIHRCKFQLSQGDEYYETIRLVAGESLPYFVDISNNVVNSAPPSVSISLTGPVAGAVVNNTFVGPNTGVIASNIVDLRIQENIFADCAIVGIDAYGANCSYNAFWHNGADYWENQSGTFDIIADPLFVDTANGDFGLLCNSPCIDAGDPASVGFSGKRKDIGAFEYQYVVGNADGHLGSADINITDAVFLVNRIFSGGPAPCPAGAGMIDCDNLITISDVVYLVNYLYAHGPAPCIPGQ